MDSLKIYINTYEGRRAIKPSDHDDCRAEIYLMMQINTNLHWCYIVATKRLGDIRKLDGTTVRVQGRNRFYIGPHEYQAALTSSFAEEITELSKEINKQPVLI